MTTKTVHIKETVLMIEEWDRLRRNGEISLNSKRIKNPGTSLFEHLLVTPEIGSPKEYVFCIFEKSNLREQKIHLDQIKELKALTQEALPTVQAKINNDDIGVVTDLDQWEALTRKLQGENNEVLLTTREWMKFKRFGSIRIPGYRIKAGEHTKIEDHFAVAPDIGQTEDSYILCKLRIFDKHQETYFLDQVSSFLAMTERAKNILQYEDTARQPENFLGVVEPTEWDRINQNRIIKERWERGNEFVNLVSGKKQRSNKYSHDQAIEREKVRNELIGMTRLSDNVKNKNRKFLATPAGGFKIALSYLSLELIQGGKDKQDIRKEQLNKAWKGFQVGEKLEQLYKGDKSGPVLDEYFENFSNGYFDELKKQMKLGQNKNLMDSFRWRVFFYHYTGLIGDEDKTISLEDLTSDIKTLIEPYSGRGKKIPTDLLNIFYALGGEFPDEALYRFKQAWEPLVEKKKGPKSQDKGKEIVQGELFSE